MYGTIREVSENKVPCQVQTKLEILFGRRQEALLHQAMPVSKEWDPQVLLQA